MPSRSKVPSLDELRVSARVKLSAIWASVTFCYIYCDYFELYQPGKLQSMLEGKFGPLGPTSQGVLLGASVFLAVPSLMVFLTIALPARVSRLLNLIFGVFYSIVMLLILPRVWLFYEFFATVEILLTMSAVWLAWKWPRSSPVAEAGAA